METVGSKDGTTIAYEKFGEGPTVILITGALGTRMDTDLASHLSPHFTVIDYDRRGRGDSSDTQPFAPEREIEDIEALIEANGGSAYLYGISSGAALALEAANKLPGKVKKLAMYEPPFIVDDSHAPLPADYVQQLKAAIAAGNPGDAVEIFMTKAVGIPAEYVAQMRNAPLSEQTNSATGSPDWRALERVAHTLAYDGMFVAPYMAGKPLPAGQWSAAKMPTLVIVGGESEPFFFNGTRALVDNLPNAKHRVLEGQDHNVASSALAPMLIEFFTGKA